tara:strand:+ start:295 stop:417 length:123 start_codon:yes stop_codon:yes gene_type:complete
MEFLDQLYQWELIMTIIMKFSATLAIWIWVYENMINERRR